MTKAERDITLLDVACIIIGLALIGSVSLRLMVGIIFVNFARDLYSIWHEHF